MSDDNIYRDSYISLNNEKLRIGFVCEHQRHAGHNSDYPARYIRDKFKLHEIKIHAGFLCMDCYLELPVKAE